jgi:hypothetical protein
LVRRCRRLVRWRRRLIRRSGPLNRIVEKNRSRRRSLDKREVNSWASWISWLALVVRQGSWIYTRQRMKNGRPGRVLLPGKRTVHVLARPGQLYYLAARPDRVLLSRLQKKRRGKARRRRRSILRHLEDWQRLSLRLAKCGQRRGQNWRAAGGRSRIAGAQHLDQLLHLERMLGRNPVIGSRRRRIKGIACRRRGRGRGRRVVMVRFRGWRRRVVMLRFRWGRGRSTLGMRLRWLVGNPRPEASMIGLVGDHLGIGQRPYTCQKSMSV